jgi:transcriptional regulator with XRE-family HTH domain
MDAIRIGLSLRALRHRRRLTQQALARITDVSRATIARMERGGADRVTIATLVKISSALGASVSVRILWHGEGLDRLLDAAHADLTDAAVRLLRDAGWEIATEVTFNEYGERGSIDILAFHPASRSLVVIEIKSVVPDLGGMLATLDRKVRVAAKVARERGWHANTVSRILVLPEDRTARRRVEQHASTFATALPSRTVAVRRWLRKPVEGLAGLLFLSDVHHAGTRHRVRRARTSVVRGGGTKK